MSDAQTTAPTTLPITLADAKKQLHLSHSRDDEQVERYVGAATDYYERRANRALMHQTRELKMDGFDDPRYVFNRVIYPPMAPLSSVSSVKYIDTNNTTQTLSTTAYRVSTADEPGRISEEFDDTWPATRGVSNDVTVTYVCGHSSSSTGVPERHKQALRLMVAHLYRNREATITGTISKEIELGFDAFIEELPDYG